MVVFENEKQTDFFRKCLPDEGEVGGDAKLGDVDAGHANVLINMRGGGVDVKSDAHGKVVRK